MLFYPGTKKNLYAKGIIHGASEPARRLPVSLGRIDELKSELKRGGFQVRDPGFSGALFSCRRDHTRWTAVTAKKSQSGITIQGPEFASIFKIAELFKLITRP